MPTTRRPAPSRPAPSRTGPARSGRSRRDPARRPRRRRSGIVAVALALVAVGLVWLLGVSSLLDVDTDTGVVVDGASPDTYGLVLDAARPDPGTSLVWLDTGAVAARVLAIPRVATVDVRRTPPGELDVTVTERTPVVGAPVAGGTALVDAGGFAYRTATDAPAGLPVLRLLAPSPVPGGAPVPAPSGPSPADPATVAAVHVVGSLPAALRARVVEVRTVGPYDVELTLADGPVIRWGGDDRDDTKAAVLAALLTRPGRTYDVSSPEIAVVS